MKILVGELTPEHIGQVIRFEGRSSPLSYGTLMCLEYYTTYKDCMELGDIYGEDYMVDFDTEIILEEQ